MTTNTLDTTRLSEEQLRKTFGMITRWCQNDLGYLEPFAASQVELLQRHIDTLTADLARVEAERDRYREALEFYACEDTYGMDMEGDGTPIPDSIVVLNDHGFIADLALNGGTDAE